MPSAAKRAVLHDPTVYPIQDDMGEGSLQRLVSELLRALIERWLRDRREAARGPRSRAKRPEPVFVGADQFFYWKQFDSSEGIAPDVYVLPGAPASPKIGAWKVWETGFVPTFAFEFVSRDVDKDYLASPAKYARLGVDELIVFDPDYEQSRTRTRWQIFRKSKRGFLRVEASDADRVGSKILGCHLRAVGEGGDLRVRLATGFNGEALVPTDPEARADAEAAAHAARAELEAAKVSRPADQGLRAELEVANAARAALEAEVARLRAAQKPRRSR